MFLNNNVNNNLMLLIIQYNVMMLPYTYDLLHCVSVPHDICRSSERLKAKSRDDTFHS